jgi:murein L,D-transpeptidase YcbB/YkuD
MKKPTLAHPAALIAASLLALLAPVAARAQTSLDLTVDLSERELVARVGGKVVGQYPVSVGQPGHSTPTGSYRLSRVVWNPSWTPPREEKWAKDRKRTGPNDPGNPMGAVKIFFSNELYIHGTSETSTLGEPVSHGCIRIRNRDAEQIARLVMENGGAHRSPAWYAAAQRNDAREDPVSIPHPSVLRVVP